MEGLLLGALSVLCLPRPLDDPPQSCRTPREAELAGVIRLVKGEQVEDACS